MSSLNVTPLLDALGGTTSTPATFRATVMRARRPATRVDGPTVTLPQTISCTWNGTEWDHQPTITQIPVDCYWNIVIRAAGQRLEIDAVLPGTNPSYNVGDLTTVTPDTAQPDTSTIAQYAAVTQQATNQIQQMQDIAAQVADTAQTLQGLIAQANSAVQAVSTLTSEPIDGDAS